MPEGPRGVTPQHTTCHPEQLRLSTRVQGSHRNASRAARILAAAASRATRAGGCECCGPKRSPNPSPLNLGKTGRKQRNDCQHERGQHPYAADRCGERVYELVSRLERDDDETEMV